MLDPRRRQKPGESFLNLLQSGLVPNGLYLFDEPEVPLSPQRQLALLALLTDMVREDCQFIIATPSPILMAFPDAQILCFDEGRICEVPHDELAHVSFPRDSLNTPERCLRRL